MSRSLTVLSLLLPAAALATSADELLRGAFDHGVEASAEGSVAVQNICGEVTVLGVPHNQVRVVGNVEKDGEVSVRQDSDQRTILEVRPVRERGRNQQICATLRIEVPQSSKVSVGTVSADIRVGAVQGVVRLESVSGDINLGPGARSAQLEAVSGDVTAVGVLGELEIEAVSGDVSVMDAKGELEIETVSGKVEMSGTFERLEVETVSGNISMTGPVAATGRIELESHSGDVVLALPASSGADIEMETFSGELKAAGGREMAGLGSALEMKHGNGGADISIVTFSGDAEVKTR